MQALHLALTEPHQFLRELPQDLGLAPGQEDASLAYRLFDQVRQLWLAVFAHCGVAPGQEDASLVVCLSDLYAALRCCEVALWVIWLRGEPEAV